MTSKFYLDVLKRNLGRSHIAGRPNTNGSLTKPVELYELLLGCLSSSSLLPISWVLSTPPSPFRKSALSPEPSYTSSVSMTYPLLTTSGSHHTQIFSSVGGIACFTGLQLSSLFCKLDSHEFPIKTYGDLAGRILGTPFRHMTTVLQSLQLIINVNVNYVEASNYTDPSLQVGVICLSNAQSVEQLAANHQFCFSVSVLIWAFVGMVLGQIRSLQKYTYLANS